MDRFCQEKRVREIIYIGLAGAMGTLSRYGLGNMATKILGTRFAYSTLLVNVLGSLIIGFVMQVGLLSDAFPRLLRTSVAIGFLGAFTTRCFYYVFDF
jgi:CrcB protein